jgi:hypothetical protein
LYRLAHLYTIPFLWRNLRPDTISDA